MYKRIIVGIIIGMIVLIPIACKKGSDDALRIGSISDFRTLIDKDAIAYFRFDLKMILEKGIFKEFFEGDGVVEGLDILEKNTVINFYKSIKDAVLVILKHPSDPANFNQYKQYFIISMKNDSQNKIVETLKMTAQNELKTMRIGGYTVFHAADINTDTVTGKSKDLYFYFKNNELIFVAYDKNVILKVCQLTDGKIKALDEESDLYEITEKMNHNQMFWGLLTIPESVKKEILKKQPGIMMFPVLQDITNISLGGTYDSNILSIEVNIFTTKEESLKKLRDTLDFVKKITINYAAQSEKRTPDVELSLKVWDKMIISQEKDSVKMNFKFTKAEIEKMISEEALSEE